MKGDLEDNFTDLRTYRMPRVSTTRSGKVAQTILSVEATPRAISPFLHLTLPRHSISARASASALSQGHFLQ